MSRLVTGLSEWRHGEVSLRGAGVVGLSQVVDGWASGLPGEAGEASEAISPYRRYPRGQLLLLLPLYLEPEVPVHLSCFTKAPRLPRQHHELLGLKPRESSREASPPTRHRSPTAYPVKPSSGGHPRQQLHPTTIPANPTANVVEKRRWNLRRRGRRGSEGCTTMINPLDQANTPKGSGDDRDRGIPPRVQTYQRRPLEASIRRGYESRRPSHGPRLSRGI
jgi:hypothetical protein